MQPYNPYFPFQKKEATQEELQEIAESVESIEDLYWILDEYPDYLRKVYTFSVEGKRFGTAHVPYIQFTIWELDNTGFYLMTRQAVYPGMNYNIKVGHNIIVGWCGFFSADAEAIRDAKRFVEEE
jgi:hypothetical protein